MSEEESNNTSPRTILLLGFSLISAIWALYLVQVHNDAEHNNLIRVCSVVPKVGVVPYWQVNGQPFLESLSVHLLFAQYALLFVMGLQGLSQKYHSASLGGFCAFGGLLFGIYLLYHMIFSVEQICRYCLIMDGLNHSVCWFPEFHTPKA